MLTPALQGYISLSQMLSVVKNFWQQNFWHQQPCSACDTRGAGCPHPAPALADFVALMRAVEPDPETRWACIRDHGRRQPPERTRTELTADRSPAIPDPIVTWPDATEYVYTVHLEKPGEPPLTFGPADAIAHIEDAFGNVGIEVTVECRPA
jgi:hypothetical protein